MRHTSCEIGSWTFGAVQSQRGTSKKREREHHIFMSSLTQSCSRSEAAKCFYDVLVLQAKGALHMSEQTQEYEDLKILLLDKED